MIYGIPPFEFAGLILLGLFALWVGWHLVRMRPPEYVSHGETISRLAQSKRREFLRRGREVTAKEIKRDLDRANPPLYTHHSVRN